MKKDLKDPIYILVLLTMILSLTNFVGNLANLFIFSVTSIAMIVKGGPRLISNKSIFLLNSFYLIFLLYGLIGYGLLSFSNFKAPLYAIVSIYTAFFVSSYIDRFNARQIKIMLIISLLALAISLGIATFIATINPMAIRLMFGDVEKQEMLEDYVLNFTGLITYSQAHALSVISTGLCVLFCYAKNRWIKFFSLLLWGLTIKLLFDMIITTALLVAVFSCFLIILNKYSKGNTVLSFFLFLFVPVVLFSSGVITELLSFAESSNAEIFYKLDELVSIVEGGSNQGQQMGYRNELYRASFNTFLSNPLFGFGKDNGSRTIIGEHSFVLDYLAYYGLFALLYFGAWWRHYRTVVIKRNVNYKKVCIYSFIPVFMLIFLKAEAVCILMPFASLVFLKIIFSYLQNEKIIEVKL